MVLNTADVRNRTSVQIQEDEKRLRALIMPKFPEIDGTRLNAVGLFE
jgi:hypothetical protein